MVVVGAGAAGILAGLFARRAGCEVLLLERTRDGGRKILVSGGGRCNILPSQVQPERFVTDSSRHSLRNILRSWPLEEQVSFFERELAMRLVLEPEAGKFFPETHRARDVRDRLIDRVRGAGAAVRFGATVTGVHPPSGDRGAWLVNVDGAGPLEAACVVLASGGLSVPSTGSDGMGLRLARALGHSINPTYPALTPLTASPPIHAHLAGVSLEVTIRAPGSQPRFETTGGFLFTHRGYSGPAVLDASHLTTRSGGAGGLRQELKVQWTEWEREAWDRALIDGRGRVGPFLSRRMPTRLADQLLVEARVPSDQSLAQLDRDSRSRLVALLADYALPWAGNEGYRKAEVTGGGIPLSEIDPVTMESRVCSGLFVCGEMLDAFGPIGGHNFLWA
ncbi:MAG: aminoacetone oxidase family FAD-binding enzyme, partial [Gemmatimonadales bacterium]|nr:aminoacetone oxidase family FAD-binding enzyme [Gemmatimonadales bacterium]